MLVYDVSTSRIWVRQFQCLRDLNTANNKNTDNTCPLNTYIPSPDTYHNHIKSKHISHSGQRKNIIIKKIKYYCDNFNPDFLDYQYI